MPFEFETEFGKMKYSLLGEGDGKSYAVMLQGWATERSLYEGVASLLAEKYTVVFPAMPGFGESDEPPSPMCVSDYAKAVNELLSHIGIKEAVFFCHSFGGRIFLKLNSMEDRYTEPTSAVLCDIAGIVPRLTLKKKLKRLAVKLMKPFSSVFPSLAEGLRRRMGSSDYASASPVMRATLSNVVSEDLRHLAPAVSAPALIMWGRYDSAVPLSDAYLYESLIPDSGVAVFEASEHFPFLTEAPKFMAVLRSFFNI